MAEEVHPMAQRRLTKVVYLNSASSVVAFGVYAALRSRTICTPLQFHFLQHCLTLISLLIAIWLTGKKAKVLTALRNLADWKPFIWITVFGVLGKYYQNGIFPFEHDLGFCLSCFKTADYLVVAVCLFALWIFRKINPTQELGKNIVSQYIPKTLITATIFSVLSWTRQDHFVFIGAMISAGIKSAFCQGLFIFFVGQKFSPSKYCPLNFTLNALFYSSLLLFVLCLFTPPLLPNSSPFLTTGIQGLMDCLLVGVGAAGMILSLCSEYWLLLHISTPQYLFLWLARSSATYILWYIVMELGSWYFLTPLNFISNAVVLVAFFFFFRVSLSPCPTQHSQQHKTHL